MNLSGQQVLAFTDDEFEDLEMWYPVLRLREAGATVVLAGPKANTRYSGKYGVPLVSDVSFEDVNADNFAGLYVPGGWAPDKLRRYASVLDLTRSFHVVDRHIVSGRRPPDLPAFTHAFVKLLADRA